jgi:hypothetical protein
MVLEYQESFSQHDKLSGAKLGMIRNIYRIFPLLLLISTMSCSDLFRVEERGNIIEISNGAINWDIYDSIDLVNGYLHKFDYRSLSPAGHIRLDSQYENSPSKNSVGAPVISRLKDNVSLEASCYDASVDTIKIIHTDNHGNLDLFNYDSVTDWPEYNKHITVFVSVADSNFYNLLFEESIFKFNLYEAPEIFLRGDWYGVKILDIDGQMIEYFPRLMGLTTIAYADTFKLNKYLRKDNCKIIDCYKARFTSEYLYIVQLPKNLDSYNYSTMLKKSSEIKSLLKLAGPDSPAYPG